MEAVAYRSDTTCQVKGIGRLAQQSLGSLSRQEKCATFTFLARGSLVATPFLPVCYDVSFYHDAETQVFRWQAGTSILWKQEGYRDARRFSGPNQRLLTKDGLAGESEGFTPTAVRLAA